VPTATTKKLAPSTARRKCKEFFAANNIDVLDINVSGYGLQLNLWSPPGTNWVSSGGNHCLTIHYFTDAGAAWVALWEDVKHGLTECNVEDCDTCTEEKETTR
jgi:hypothetical protein